MKHTPEQLAAMSDLELNKALTIALGHNLLVDYPHDDDESSVCNTATFVWVNYCTDWAVTAPLMAKYGVAPLAVFGELRGATNNTYEYHEPYGSIVHSSENKNPLRAVVECLILVLQEGE